MMKKEKVEKERITRISFAVLIVVATCWTAQASWKEQVKLLASDGSSDDVFGSSVSVSDNYIVIGSVYGNGNELNSGSAYIFKQSDIGNDPNWYEQCKLIAADGTSNDHFGYAVCINGNYAIVGAQHDDSMAGSAYVFKRSDIPNDPNWYQQAKLIASDRASSDYFGREVSLDGEYAIVAAHENDDKGNNSGSAYIFKRDESSGSWSEHVKLLASDGADGDLFGFTVTINGDYAIVGAYKDDDKGGNSGSAYIFYRNEGGPDNWGQQAKLLAPDGATGDYFGYSVSMSGDYAIVGAYYGDGNENNSGSAYIFYRNEGGPNNWGHQAKLLASDGAAIDSFGESVSISGKYAIVGATYHDEYAGSAYIFNRDGTSWTQVKKLTALDAEVEDFFGVSVSINRNYAIVGANGNNDYGYNSGSAYVFNYEQVIYHVDGATGDNTNDGLTRETAFKTIQRGINVAEDYDMVLVWPGVYNETATHGINFKGKAITVKSAADAAVLEVPGFVAATFVQGEDENSVLSNFVLRKSTAGIFALFANPTINNVTVVDNDNGIIADNADPLITNSIFWNNINGDLFGSPDPITAQYSFVQEGIEDGLVAHWKLDGDAVDSAGTNHGTIYGATPATGQVGGALNFDGDDYVQVADDDSLDISDEITISAWINPSKTSSIRMIVSKYKDYAGESYLLELKYEKNYFVLAGISSLSGVQNFSTGTWYHVAATYDGSRMRVYTNGELDNELAISGTIPITTQELNIGRQADNKIAPFEGLVDEVRIYDRGLSSEEIEGLYNAGLAGYEYGPLFADVNNGDYHLLSERGRYRATTDEWILDEVTSPCIDCGDPSVNPSNERMPNGGRINMGAYGNTAYASMSEWPIKGDVNNDGRFNFVDIAILLDGWLQELPWAR
jgi:hypothetical protein